MGMEVQAYRRPLDPHCARARYADNRAKYNHMRYWSTDPGTRRLRVIGDRRPSPLAPRPGDNNGMVVLALVLLILVVVFSVAIVVSNPGVYNLSLFRVLVPVTSAGVYFTGVGAAVLTVVALLLLRLGIRRSREQRQRLRSADQAAAKGAPETLSVASSGAGSSVAEVVPAKEEPLAKTTRPATDPDVPASTGPTANLELDPPTAMSPAERRALLDEVDEVSRDEPKQ
jgi:hypothetical protein